MAQRRIMELIRSEWTKEDGKEFNNFLLSQARKEKIEWTKNIYNTKQNVLAIEIPKLKRIAKEISKGNFISFLDLKLNEYFENIAINGALISNINDFKTYAKYLMEYVKYIDNWANCDILKFNTKGKEEEFFDLSLTLLRHKNPFARRIGVNIWFKFIDTDFLPKIFNVINKMNEEEYYVNMCVAWFVAECFVKQREQTLKFLSSHKMNKFSINKTISKCRDSFRVSNSDREMLLKFRVK